jgi:uncharacterized membrane protein YdcZ (DUF606 family)
VKTALSTINLVVGGLVLLGLALLALVGIIAVIDTPASVPEALWTVVGGVVGALSAMLARTSAEAPPPPTQLSAQPEHGTFPGKTP